MHERAGSREDEVSLKDLLCIRREAGAVPEDAMRALGAEWLSAIQVFGADALNAGVPTSVVMPAVVQMLEGWMLAHEPSSLATSWAALDATITLLHLLLQDVTRERDALAHEVEQLRSGDSATRSRTGPSRRHRPKRAKAQNATEDRGWGAAPESPAALRGTVA